MDGFIDKFAQRKNAQEMIRANAMAEAEEKEKMASQLKEYEMAMQEMRRCNLMTLENAEKVRKLLEAGLDKIEAVQKRNGDEGNKAEELREIKLLLEGMKARVAEVLEGMDGRMAEILETQNSRTAEMLEGQKDQITRALESQKEQAADLLREQSALLEKQNADVQEMMEAQKKTLEELLHDTEDFTHKESVKVYRNVQAVIENALPKQTAEITESVKNELKGNGNSAGLKAVWILTLTAALANVAIEVLKFLGYI